MKISDGKISADNKIDYLMRLELPFFIGIVSQSPAQMEIYSAEFLPILFSDVGQPDSLSLIPVSGLEFDRSNYYERVGLSNNIRLKCPLVTTLGIGDDRTMLAPKVNTLLGICTRTHNNIATRVNEEHIYQVDDLGTFRIVAGPGSAKFFRMNFLKRLGEVFYNLYFILGQAPPDKHLSAEIKLFQSLYDDLKKLQGWGPSLPTPVSAPYVALQQKLAQYPGEARVSIDG